MHRRGLRALVSGVVITTLAAGLPAGTAQAAPQATAGTTAPGAATDRAEQSSTSVTLITGDRVSVHDGDRLAVQAGPGRAGMRFISQTIKNHRYVIPHDALPLLRDDRLDRRLFDVTTLIEFGYDDRAGELPLLVSYPDAKARQGARAAATVDGARVVRDLPVIGALAVRADRAARTTLWGSLTAGAANARSLRAGVDKIWLDGKRKPTLDVSVPQIGAPTAWKAGFDGTGVKVAVLDTGMDATHPDLVGQIAGAQNFTDEPDTDDMIGHGTHVASTIAGTGAASGGRYKGVAPGAKLLNGKVCSDTSGCDDSWILAGMEWAAQQGAQVISISLGGSDAPSIDPLEQAVNELTAQFGALFVIAAGNDGADASVGSPASADAALAVGAVDSGDDLADFSSRGPRRGDDAIKPEITAPGVDIVAAKAEHDQIGGPAPVAGYTTMSGTSMATPHVAGAAAILTQQHPDWSWSLRKNILMGSAKPNPELGVFSQGAGRVDVAREITQTVSSEPGSISFGRQLWPHDDDQPMAKTVTYRNSGSAPVTLALTATNTAPAGLFTLGASSLTVPAGGTASTTLTANTAVQASDGYYSGYLTATAPGGVQVPTPFAVNREVESYDVTFEHTSRDGSVATDYFTSLLNLETFEYIDVFAEAGANTVRVPRGTYGLFSWIYGGWEDEDPANNEQTMLVQPKLAVDANTGTLRLAASQAKPVSVTVPAADAVPSLIGVTAEWAGPEYSHGATALADVFEGLYSGQLKPQSGVENFIATVTASFAKPDAEGNLRNSPYTYDLAWFDKGSFYNGFTKNVRARELATVKTSYAKQAEGAEGVRSNFAALPGSSSIGWAVLLPFDLPFRRTEYFNTDDGALWTSYFDEELIPEGDEWPEVVSSFRQTETSYRPGRTYSERWNTAVFGPSVANAPSIWPDAWASRTGDVIVAGIPLHADGQGRSGFSTADSARIALYRNDTLIAEAEDMYDEFEVPTDRAAYRLEVSANRGAPHPLSSRVEAAWTFSSGHVAGEPGVDFDRLPLSSVRFSPALDLTNTAAAGRAFSIPVTVDRQADSAAARNRSLTVEVSYDDGRNWRKAVLLGSGANRTAVVRHPAGSGFVSLRAKAADTAGNTVTSTVIRAYRIG